MEAIFKVGDIVGVNSEYHKKGKAYFGRHLKHKNFKGTIVKVHENTNDEKDGFGDIWQNFYEFKGGISICEIFLKKYEA